MAPFYSSFKPHDHWQKGAPPLTRSSVPLISRKGRNDKFVASICDEKCLTWFGDQEDKFLVPVIDDDFNWFRLSIVANRVSAVYCERDSGVALDERRGNAISTITDPALRSSRCGDLRSSRWEDLMSMEEFVAKSRMSRCWDIDEDVEDADLEDGLVLSPPSMVWQSDRAGRLQTYVPNPRRMRWENTTCEEAELEADVPVEMNANRSHTELEASCYQPPQRRDSHTMSVASVRTANFVNTSSENAAAGIGRWSGVTLLNYSRVDLTVPMARG